MIYGNKEGIRDSMLAKLETLYDIEIPTEVFAPAELLFDLLLCFFEGVKDIIFAFDGDGLGSHVYFQLKGLIQDI